MAYTLWRKKDFANLPFLDHLLQIAIGRGNHVHVGVKQFTAANGIELMLLQDPEQLALDVQRKFAHFIQKKCAMVCKLELSNFACLRAGIGAFLVTKKFVSKRSLGIAPQLIANKRTGCPITE